VSTLGINNGIRLVFTPMMPLLFSSFPFFPLLFPKPPLFFADHQTCLRKMTISDSFTVWSSWNLSTKFATQFRGFSPLGITRNDEAERNTLRIIAFFPAETQNCLGKATIPNSLTIGCRKIVICCSRFNSAHLHRWDLRDK